MKELKFALMLSIVWIVNISCQKNSINLEANGSSNNAMAAPYFEDYFDNNNNGWLPPTTDISGGNLNLNFFNFAHQDTVFGPHTTNGKYEAVVQVSFVSGKLELRGAIDPTFGGATLYEFKFGIITSPGKYRDTISIVNAGTFTNLTSFTLYHAPAARNVSISSIVINSI